MSRHLLSAGFILAAWWEMEDEQLGAKVSPSLAWWGEDELALPGCALLAAGV